MEKFYDHKHIETTWQQRWREANVFAADDQSTLPKYYTLCMFPYPSAQGLHVGHPESYTAVDILARYRRMRGYNVLNPIGWDAFGLPAENYAIKMGVPPWQTTAANIKNFTRQIQSLGFSYDWSREVNTSDPRYYKWTQWLFLQMYKHGLAYKKQAKVNWCDHCQTVLANEQVVNGKCERCDHDVIQKDLEQWFFKITAYADALLQGLDELDWPDSIKATQRNWVGRSEGAELEFGIQNQDYKIKVFTTRPDTIYGATYMVLAPEHEFIAQLLAIESEKSKVENAEEVRRYVEQAQKKSELQRTDLSREKTGVELKGVMAINPATTEPIPIFIADYVLPGYGTGAIMAVPAHDQRDWEFAQKFGLPIVQVIRPTGGALTGVYEENGNLINSGEFDGLGNETAMEKITAKVGGHMTVQYRLRDWLISRQRYWGAPIPIIYCQQCGTVPVPEKDLPVLLPLDIDFKPTGESPLVRSQEFHAVTCPTCGQPARRESDTMDTFVCSSWYFLRYADPHNDQAIFSREAMRRWLPVDFYIGGAEHANGHLLFARFFTRALKDFGLLDFDEPFIKLRNQGMILGEDNQKMSKSRGNVINPDEVVSEYGADTMRVYEMFMGPLEEAKPWSTSGIIGARRFLEKIWLVTAEWLAADRPHTESRETTRLFHQTIRKVTGDIEQIKFNTAISALMILVNHLAKVKSFSQEQLESLVKLLSVFAPHVAEELWRELGHTDFVCQQSWPTYDDSLARAETVTITVQVNGKLRATLVCAPGVGQEAVTKQALEQHNVNTHTAGKDVKKIIFVPDKLLNIVVAER